MSSTCLRVPQSHFANARSLEAVFCARLCRVHFWTRAMPLSPDVVEKVKAYIKQAEDGGHVAAISILFTYLKSINLMYTQRVIPSLVHIHPDNRDGLGCYPTEVHGLLSDIGSSGWSWSEAKAIATEVPHGDTKVEEFNRKLIQSSQGMLPEVQPGTVKFASLSATHTNLVLRLFAAGCKHSDERFCTSGHLSMVKTQTPWRHFPWGGDAWTFLAHFVLRNFEFVSRASFPHPAHCQHITAIAKKRDWTPASQEGVCMLGEKIQAEPAGEVWRCESWSPEEQAGMPGITCQSPSVRHAVWWG